MIKRVLVALAASALVSTTAAAGGATGVSLSKDKRITSVSQGTMHYTPAQLPRKSIIFSNIGTLYPKGLYFCCYGDTISGPSSVIGTPYSAALQFTPATDVSVTEVDAGVGWVEGTNAVQLAIYDDNGGVPGTSLASATVKGLGTFGDCCTLAVARIKKLPLTAGTPYWVVVSASGTTWAAWAFNSTDEIDPVTAAYNDGTGWGAGGGAIPAPSFAVIGK
jgi:hypothetical protein